MEDTKELTTGDRGCRCTCSPVNIHIRMLYFWTFILSGIIATGAWYFHQEVKYLKSELEDKLSRRDILDLRVFPKLSDDVYSQMKEHVVDGDSGFVERGEKVNFDLFDWMETDGNAGFGSRFKEQSLNSWKRRKRHAFFEGSGSEENKENWMWMSGYSRIPMVAIEAYCKASKEYCAVHGSAGPPGVPGAKGEKGDTGHTGLSGEKGDAGDEGKSLDLGLVAASLRNNQHLRGPAGEKGDQGVAGLHGPKGEQGDEGPPGPVGPPGIAGKPGQNGKDGAPGKKGDVGPKGMRGLLGFPGKKGAPGSQGPEGPPGHMGPTGKDGLDGIPGTPGVPGLNGTDGDSGRRGRKGDAGLNGVPGARGMNGIPGVPGLKGQKGDSGNPGSPGMVGMKGDRGYKGENGICQVRCGNPLMTTTTTTALTTPLTTATTTATTVATTPPPTIPPRTSNCYIHIIGKPLFHRQSSEKIGSWMQDPAPLNTGDGSKIWVMYGVTGNKLVEYASRNMFKKNEPSAVHNLGNIPFYGTGNVIFMGSLYYQWRGLNKVVRYDLEAGAVVAVRKMTGSLFKGPKAVYNTNNVYYDFSVDENGLWVIYATDAKTSKMKVAKLEPDSLVVLKTWTLEVPAQTHGNGFVMCGILYLVESSTERRTQLDYAYDMYTSDVMYPGFRFTNPYRYSVMVTYNHQQRKIFAWDAGSQVTYPMLIT